LVRDFELLVPAAEPHSAWQDSSDRSPATVVGTAVGHLIRQNVVGMEALATQRPPPLPPLPADGSVSARAAAVVNIAAAAAFAASVEVPATDLERSLLHMLCWVRARPRDAVTKLMAPTLPLYLFHAVGRYMPTP